MQLSLAWEVLKCVTAHWGGGSLPIRRNRVGGVANNVTPMHMGCQLLEVPARAHPVIATPYLIRVNRQLLAPDDRGDEIERGEEVVATAVIPGGDSAPMLQLVKGPFNQVALPVQFTVVFPRVPEMASSAGAICGPPVIQARSPGDPPMGSVVVADVAAARTGSGATGGGGGGGIRRCCWERLDSASAASWAMIRLVSCRRIGLASGSQSANTSNPGVNPYISWRTRVLPWRDAMIMRMDWVSRWTSDSSSCSSA